MNYDPSEQFEVNIIMDAEQSSHFHWAKNDRAVLAPSRSHRITT
jgi:hypothetical protein